MQRKTRPSTVWEYFLYFTFFLAHCFSAMAKGDAFAILVKVALENFSSQNEGALVSERKVKEEQM